MNQQHPDSLDFDDVMDEAIEAIVRGVDNIDVRAAMEGGAEDSDQEEEHSLSDEQLSIREVQQALVKIADFFDNRSDSVKEGQMCRDLAFVARGMMVASIA